MEQGRDTSADQEPLAQQSTLAERIAQLEALVLQQQAAIAAYQEQLERQHEQLVLLKRALFSSRRERYLPSPCRLPINGCCFRRRPWNCHRVMKTRRPAAAMRNRRPQRQFAPQQREVAARSSSFLKDCRYDARSIRWLPSSKPVRVACNPEW
jgi:hypothetical protein